MPPKISLKIVFRKAVATGALIGNLFIIYPKKIN